MAKAENDVNLNRFEKENIMADKAGALKFEMPLLVRTVLQLWSVGDEYAILRNIGNGTIWDEA